MKRRTLHRWMAVSVMLAGCAPATTSPTPTGSVAPTAAPSAAPSATSSAAAGFAVSGQVFDDDLHGLAAEVKAEAEGQSAIAATADAGGRYTLRLPAGTYRITATKAGFTTRTQAVTVTQDAKVDFGGQTDAGANPYFLSTTPEIASVDVNEPAPAGPLSLVFHFSEPLTAAGQERFAHRVFVTAGDAKPLIYGSGASDSIFKTEAAWDAEGKAFTLTYREPYLASGAAAATYTARLEQDQTGEIDPVSRDPLWDPLGVVDAEGNELGHNRADYAFLSPQLFTIKLDQLANKDFGETHPIRRWVLTHQSTFSWAAKKDDVPPGLVSARATVGRRLGTSSDDVLELHLTEPMRVIRNQTDLQYTLLKKENQLVYVNVSDSTDGANAKPLDIPVADITFSRTEPNVVYLHYALKTFENRKWVEVVLGPDMKDPVGNSPDPQKNRIVGTLD